jgi:deazaflavin-dependent oxidoreductase (nitroreductase family)
MDHLTLMERFLLVPILRVHDVIYRKTKGRIGQYLPGLLPPSLLLHTIGAKTGQHRAMPLTYAREGDSYIVVASAGGLDRQPGWYHNLLKHPDVEINVGPKRFPATARRVGPEDADYPRLWELVNDNNKNRYTAYQKRTSRPIPLFVLTPV